MMMIQNQTDKYTLVHSMSDDITVLNTLYNLLEQTLQSTLYHSK